MPYSEHETLETPPPKTPIWRYRTVPQLISILEDEQLWFSRADLFDDPLEGSVPKPVAETRHNWASEDDWPHQKTLGEVFDIEDEEINQMDMGAQMELANKHQRKISFLNCWHVNNRESVAMWDLYAENGVAIQTTFQKFTEALRPSDDRIYAGLVWYIDFFTSRIPESPTFLPLFVKRLGYQHEHEVRALIYDFELMAEHGLLEEPDVEETGRPVSVDLDRLIETIYVAPKSPAYLEKAVRAVSAKYGFEDRVKRSSLDEEPVY